MSRDPRIDQLLVHLTTLQEQHNKFKVQVGNFVDKLPADSPERERMNGLADQLAIAIEKACQELEKLGVSRAEINKVMKIENPAKKISKKWIIVGSVAALLVVAGVFFFLMKGAH